MLLLVDASDSLNYFPGKILETDITTLFFWIMLPRLDQIQTIQAIRFVIHEVYPGLMLTFWAAQSEIV